MSSTKKFLLLASMMSVVVSLAFQTVATAQTTDTTASTPKQIARTQRKADRKAARDKKNAELSKLERNGYNPAGNKLDYPQNLQNAEKRAANEKAASTP